VKVPTIDERHFERGAVEFLSAAQSAKTSTNNNDSMIHDMLGFGENPLLILKPFAADLTTGSFGAFHFQTRQ
jgi:hypothetical protein